VIKKLLPLLLLVACATVMAQDEKPESTGSAKIKFEKDFHDFGDIDKGEKVSVDFPFTNVGDADLEILDVKTSCGCTSAKPSKDSFKPGEKGVIPVTFDSERFSGKIKKTITVMSNSVENGTASLSIEGNIVSEVNIKPQMVSLFNIKRSEASTSEIMIDTSRMDKLEVSDVKTDLDFMKLEINQKSPKEVIIKAVVDGKVAPKDTPSFRGYLDIKTNSKKRPEIKIPVNIKFEEPVRYLPRFISFFGTKPGQSREVVVTLTPAGDGEFNITEASSSLAFVEVKPMEGEAKEKKFNVVLSDKAETGKFAGYVTLKTNLPDQPEITIPVRGSIL